MRILSLLIIIHSVFFVKAQIPLSIAEVFNYSVGDTVVYRKYTTDFYIPAPSAPCMSKRVWQNEIGFTIESKSINADTLFYSVKKIPDNNIQLFFLENIDSPFACKNHLAWARFYEMLTNSNEHLICSGDSLTMPQICPLHYTTSLQYDSNLLSDVYTYTTFPMLDREWNFSLVKKFGIVSYNYSSSNGTQTCGSNTVNGFTLNKLISDSLTYSTSFPSNISDIAKVNFTLHPNPASTHFTITTPHNLAGNILTIHNTIGQQVATHTIPPNHIIPIDQLPKGIYYIQTHHQTTPIKTKLIIQ